MEVPFELWRFSRRKEKRFYVFAAGMSMLRCTTSTYTFFRRIRHQNWILLVSLVCEKDILLRTSVVPRSFDFSLQLSAFQEYFVGKDQRFTCTDIIWWKLVVWIRKGELISCSASTYSPCLDCLVFLQKIEELETRNIADHYTVASFLRPEH